MKPKSHICLVLILAVLIFSGPSQAGWLKKIGEKVGKGVQVVQTKTEQGAKKTKKYVDAHKDEWKEKVRPGVEKTKEYTQKAYREGKKGVDEFKTGYQQGYREKRRQK